MENGIYAAVKSGESVRAFYIDEETIELQRLNRQTSANRQRKEQAEREEQQRKEKERKVQEAYRRALRRASIQTVKQEIVLGAAMAIVFSGYRFGLVNILFAAPSMVTMLSVACFKAGQLWGKFFRRR